MESASGSGHLEGVSYGEDATPSPESAVTAKKKRYHHTASQMELMESLFKECNYPNDEMRLRLSEEICLTPQQVTDWFQKRRNLLKVKKGRLDKVLLNAENENLKKENVNLKNEINRLPAVIRNVIFPNCSGPAMLGDMSFHEHHLRMENSRLKEGLAARPMLPESPLLLPPFDLEMGAYSTHFHELPPQQAVLCGEMLLPLGLGDMLLPSRLVDEDSALAGTLIMEGKKQIALELAMMPSDQLLRMCRLNKQHWLRSGCKGASDSQMEVIEEDVHRRIFPWPMVVKPLGGMEGTRVSALVIMNNISLVDAFMDSNKWMDLFPSIVSKANTIQIITPGLLGNGSGALHLMYAEIHVLSPLVPMREAYFLRFCQKKEEEESWIIVDFPLDNLQESGQMTSMRYRR